MAWVAVAVATWAAAVEVDAEEVASQRAGIPKGACPFFIGSWAEPARCYLSIMPSLATVIARFKSADRNTRLETLLDYSRKLPALPPEYEALKEGGKNLVSECQTPVYLWIGLKDGKADLHADVPRESPTVRGFVALLLNSLNGVPAAEISVVPDDLLDQMQLTETLGMMRTQGLTSILRRIKRGVANPSLQDASPGT